MPGYDVSVTVPEDLLCASCKRLLREPVQTDTGEHYCFDCLPQEYCEDKTPGMQKRRWHHDVRIKKEVSKLMVNCSNALYGCRWQGTVRNLEGHLNECHRLVTECNVSKQIEKLKEFDGRFSESVLGTKRMISAMKDIVVTLVQQSKGSGHGPLATSSQPFPFEDPVANEDLVTLAREQLAVDVQEHLDAHLRSDGGEDSMLCDSSEAASVPDPGLELPDDVEQSFKTGIEEGRAGLTQAGEDEKNLEENELRSARFMKNMGGVFTAARSRGRPIVGGKFQSALGILPDYLEDHPSCNGCHGKYIWKISGVAEERKKALANPSMPLISPPWYTDPDGYKLCTHLYLNGNGTGLGSHISIFLSVMRSDYDRILKWPLKGRMSFCLLDLEQKHWPVVQTLRSNPRRLSFQRPPPHSDMNIASGCPDFSPVSILDDKRYVDDNEMYIKCIMNTA